MNGQVTQSVMLDKVASDLNLEIVYTGRGVVSLASMSVERTGLQLAGGFFNYFDSRACRGDHLAFEECKRKG